MRPDGKNVWRHNARKKQTAECDIPEKFKIIKLLKSDFGLHGLTGEIVDIPSKEWPRFPDILIKDPLIAILLHGEGPHGNGDPIAQSQKDRKAKEDYAQRPDVKLIEIYSAQTDGYDLNLVKSQLIGEGLKPLG